MSDLAPSSGRKAKGDVPKKTRLAIEELKAAAKANGCLDCGWNWKKGPLCFRPLVLNHLTFDHVPGRGRKAFNLSDVPKKASLDDVLTEIAKCEVVCERCHRKRERARLEAADGEGSSGLRQA